jgi:hypothetical protein
VQVKLLASIGGKAFGLHILTYQVDVITVNAKWLMMLTEVFSTKVLFICSLSQS